ncbi:MAG: RDD family protein [Intrasporangiaceae bacterium]|nr:RDD family protein [Intrasporangiaceae bacterium]
MSVPGGPLAQVDQRALIGVGEYESDGRVTTSEAVEVELPVAHVFARCLSALIDLVVLAISLVALALIAVRLLDGASMAVAQTAMIVTLVLAVLGIPIALETITRGKTVGKLVLGLRTVRDDGGPIGFRHAVVRGLTAWIEIYLAQGTVALTAALLTKRNRRLGDLAAGTYVINERQTMRLPLPSAMPKELEAWALGADIAALPDTLALSVRQFLVRAPSMTPQARHSLGTELARRVSRHVAPPPPPGTHPETFLAGVLADRRRRDGERLAREAALRARVTGTAPAQARGA